MFRALAASSVLALTVAVSWPVLLSGQASAAQAPRPQQPAAPAAATPESAAPFLGDWTLTLQGQTGPGVFAVTVKVEAGKVVGTISSDMLPLQKITDISTVGTALKLAYSFDYQGSPVAAVASLMPAGDTVNAELDFAGGAYVMSGTAVKKAK